MLRFASLILLSVITLCGCTKYYQVAEVRSSNVSWKSTNYVYENDTLRITYSFWANRGLVSFSVYNKLDIPIYVDWKKSAYLRNNVKNEYWSDSEISNSTTVYEGSTVGVARGNYGAAVSSGASSTTSVSSRQERITFIAPKSPYSPQSFFIGRIDGVAFGDEIKPVKIPRIDNTTKYTKAYLDSFKKEESPIVFRVYLTYSTKENFEKENYIDNEFYISKVIEMKGRQFSPDGGYTSYYYSHHRYYTLLNKD